jgi:hypothetical protein
MFGSMYVRSGLAVGAFAVFLGALCFEVVACGGGDSGSSEQDISQIMDPKERGRLYIQKRDCGSCHQSPNQSDGILSGQTDPIAGTMTYGKNLTPDMATGVGAWTDEELKKAIRSGTDRDNAQLCQIMKPFTTMPDVEVSDIVTYLRSIPAVNRAIPASHCPPLKP